MNKMFLEWMRFKPPRPFRRNYISRKCPPTPTFTLTLVIGGSKNVDLEASLLRNKS